MTAQSREEAARRADKALELHEKGLARLVIAERLNISPKNIAGMLQRARERRAKLQAVAE
jgi:orotate phosphoribosyltransferase-like protein